MNDTPTSSFPTRLVPLVFIAAILAASPLLLDLRGPEFLAVFACLFAVAAGLALVVRHKSRFPDDDPDDDVLDLDSYEAAYLSGGEKHVFDTAVICLVHRDLVTLGADRTLRRTKEPTPDDLHSIEKGIV